MPSSCNFVSIHHCLLVSESFIFHSFPKMGEAANLATRRLGVPLLRILDGEATTRWCVSELEMD